MSNLVNCLPCKGQGKYMNRQGSRIATCACCDGSGRVPQVINQDVDPQTLILYNRCLYVPILARRWNNPGRRYWEDPIKEAEGLYDKGILLVSTRFQVRHPAEYIRLGVRVEERDLSSTFFQGIEQILEDNVQSLLNNAGTITEEQAERFIENLNRQSVLGVPVHHRFTTTARQDDNELEDPPWERK